MTPLEEKIMLFRMIDRCRKVRKHKPKPVKSPVMTIEKQPAQSYIVDNLERAHYRTRKETQEIRKALQNMIDTD